MKEQEFDQVMRQKLEGYRPNYGEGQKYMGWSALEAQMPVSGWVNFLALVKKWFWLPVLFLLTGFNLYWWQQTQHSQAHTAALVQLMERMDNRMDSLHTQLQKRAAAPVKDTVFIWYLPEQFAGMGFYPNRLGRQHANNIGALGQAVGTAPRSNRSIPYYPLPNAQLRSEYGTGGSIGSIRDVGGRTNAAMPDSVPLGGTLGRRGAWRTDEATLDGAPVGRALSRRGGRWRDGTAFDNVPDLALLPPVSLPWDSVMVRDTALKTVGAVGVSKRERRSLGETLGSLLPVPSGWGFTMGMGSGQPRLGEAYLFPGVGMQMHFAYGEQWQLGLAALYQRRGYELYEVYENDYGAGMINRMPGLEAYRFGDYIEDIESIHHRVQLPLQLRYYLPRPWGKVQPFLGAGWVGTLGLQQHFEYRFEDEDDANDAFFNPNGFPTRGTDRGLRFWGGTGELATGVAYPLGRRWHMQLQAYYQHEFQATNREANPIHVLGLRFSLINGQ